MHPVRSVRWLLVLGLSAGCALKGDVRKVELQVQSLKGDVARAEAARAAERDSILAAITALQRTLATQQAYLVQLRGEMKTDLLAVQQQLVSVQELTGQSQQRLSDLRRRLEDQARQPVPGGSSPRTERTNGTPLRTAASAAQAFK
jgi:hypothetical protein